MKEVSKSKSVEDNYIEWVVALAVAFASTLTVISGILSNYVPIMRIFLGILRNFTLVLLLLYQIRHYGLRIRNRGFFIFFLVYSLYLFYYIAIAPVYKIEELAWAPSSALNLLFRTGQIIVYLLSADTILQKFNVSRFMLVSFFLSIIPSLSLILYLGADFLQYFLTSDDGVDVLGLGYDNAPLIVLSLLFFFKLFKSKLLSVLFCLLILFAGVYILFVSGERGPIVWTIFNFVICLYLTTQNLTRYVLLLFLVGVILYVNMDTVIDSLENVTPHTAEKLKLMKEGNTSGRFDTDRPEDSTYIIGLNQFSSSPLFGSYFRLITDHSVFRGDYPHNVFIEILMTMGIIGFVPFLRFLIVGWQKARRLFRTREYSANQLACLVLFLAEFLHLQTSWTIVSNSAMWCFFYIICTIDEPIKNVENVKLNTNSGISRIKGSD